LPGNPSPMKKKLMQGSNYRNPFLCAENDDAIIAGGCQPYSQSLGNLGRIHLGNLAVHDRKEQRHYLRDICRIYTKKCPMSTTKTGV
jgi:hypothetical protein